jgi:hypothetical protein
VYAWLNSWTLSLTKLQAMSGENNKKRKAEDSILPSANNENAAAAEENASKSESESQSDNGVEVVGVFRPANFAQAEAKADDDDSVKVVLVLTGQKHRQARLSK